MSHGLYPIDIVLSHDASLARLPILPLLEKENKTVSISSEAIESADEHKPRSLSPR